LGDPLVTTSLNLGWEVTELICRGVPRAGKTRPDRADLATLSDLLPWEITEISLTTVEADIYHLTSVLTQAGLDPPSTAALREAFDGEDPDKPDRAVTALHYELMRVLHAADFKSGQAYDLGRALAYTVLKPHDVESLRGQFARFRLQTLQGWLADLATALPPHTGRAVAISLDLWQRAIPDPDPSSSVVDSGTAMPKNVWGVLHRQGKLWREILTGEKSGRDMLASQHYGAAGLRMLGDTAALIWRFFRMRRVAAATCAAVVAVVTAVVLLLHFDHQAATKVTGSLLVAAAAFGVSWTGARATLGKMLAKLEQPLWQIELDTAIAEAITLLSPKISLEIKKSTGLTAVGTESLVAETAVNVAAERLPRGPDATSA
jgi:hypothetical protein